MSTLPPDAGPRRPRGRRAPRPTGEDRERAILATAEKLLADRGIDGLSVDELARGAGLSRPTFYFYYASKDAVVLALLDRVIDQVNGTALELDFVSDPAGSWGAIIQNVVDVFSEHRVVTTAAVRAAAASEEIRELWTSAMQRWIEQSAELIIAERRRGAAPDGLPARDLAIALNQMNERVLVATFTRAAPYVAEERVAGTLLDIWLAAIYGHAAVRSVSRSWVVR